MKPPPLPDHVPGSMLQCQVLRCQRRATRNFVIEDNVWGMAEVAICESHRAALDAGQPYSYHHADNVIYMGQDLQAPNDTEA
jgi:hypothetical protein